MHSAPQDFAVTVGDRSFVIRVQDGHVMIDGKTVSVSLEKVAGNLYSLILDQASYDVVLGENGATTLVSIEGTPVRVEVKDTKALLLEKFSQHRGARATAQSLRAPMPGLVLRVSVHEGDAVKTGQGIVVLEAMKMENELRAPTAGVIRKVHVTAGDAVAKNALLVEFAN